MSKSSVISGFYKLTPKERLDIVKDFASLTDDEANLVGQSCALTLDVANHMVENVIGVFPEPLGIGANFLINGKDYLIPMATEEPSVIAAASYAAKIIREGGGFHTSSTAPVMIGQIQVVKLKDANKAKAQVLAIKDAILKKANDQDSALIHFGGGAKDLDARVINTTMGEMLIVELYVDCRDAMGANAVNTMVEACSPLIEQTTGGRVCLRILSNLATKRLVRATCTVPKEAVGGADVVEGIAYASAFAAADPYRAATHNKGALNGIIATVLATGNDHRAIEAGAHAYAAINGQYTSFSQWTQNAKGDLEGSIELPMAVGLIGGAVRIHPIAKVCMKILGVKSSTELGEVLAAVGLAQNFAALRALSSEGIQRGHMSLHARNVALAAGAPTELVEVIAERMAKERVINVNRAIEILTELRNSKC
ncbi:MAG: hydroxymethylglutaryl-CoA reductase, degradative [Nitrososphaerota archaeon]|jgi:hydroxymethylglutaryl-CoA reductase|uniref:hydroxymethylglutaryl-CoA reductase, degradative n=1 Tax=Candidatus Bathycorpusculum sp. TaxID=2994959 RepID=UPI00282A7712|nr:hydroxymethylglutaryl-CoA reductase, degradative [Candidatus Termiticorpusculum sp.]MCL2292423.1 hydroxymethylglutaryl-CoA reductase, degradative [Candidatus Termiticorpusculum sp.]MDR0460991.1 hydroxymethylglutaryl-CoA reductase, degradative [Nitrososphaerota archaeon]